MKGWRKWALTAVAVALVGGCGGGGGGGGGGSPGGLVPTPPALGPVLHADAAPLRPMRDGAVYRYRGVATAFSGATPVAYITETRQTAQPGIAGVLESATNLDNLGPASRTLQVSAGVVASTAIFNFTGTDEAVSMIELRSPVRSNDQYTILERHLDDIGADIDGDGRPEALDIAIYARVIGSGTLSLPNLPSLEAVEVHTFIVVRIKLSSGPSVVDQGIQKHWYAPGVGVVRRGTDLPVGDATDRALTDETIVSWDGISEGLGAMAAQAAVVPASGGALAGTALLGGLQLYAQSAFADHALVVTETGDPSGGTIFSTLDLRGNVTASRHYPDFRRTSSGDRFAAHDGGMVHFAVPSSALDSIIALTRFDANGVLQGSIGGITIDLGGGRLGPVIDRLEVAGDGSTIWVQWLRRSVNLGVGLQYELLLRGFDAQGVAVTPELQLEAPSSMGGFFSLGGVHAKGGRALAWWQHTPDGVAFETRYAVVTPQDTTATVRQLATGLASNAFPVAFLLDTGGAFVWGSPMTGASTTLPSWAGVRLDAAFAPQRSNAGSIDSELLAGTPMLSSGVPVAPAAVGQKLVFAGNRFDFLWPDSFAAEPLDVVAMLNVGTTPLASVPARVTRSAPGFAVGPAVAQLVYPDRVLLLGSGLRLSTTVVWLR